MVADSSGERISLRISDKHFQNFCDGVERWRHPPRAAAALRRTTSSSRNSARCEEVSTVLESHGQVSSNRRPQNGRRSFPRMFGTDPARRAQVMPSPNIATCGGVAIITCLRACHRSSLETVLRPC